MTVATLRENDRTEVNNTSQILICWPKIGKNTHLTAQIEQVISHSLSGRRLLLGRIGWFVHGIQQLLELVPIAAHFLGE